MKDMVKERLILLATAQECMIEVTDKMEQWEKSQIANEKSAFESMNASDKVLNLSREGKRLIKKLDDTCKESKKGTDPVELVKLMALLEELQSLFNNITEASAAANEISHRMEVETTRQKDLGEEIKKSLNQVGKSLDSAVACAEFMLTEI